MNVDPVQKNDIVWRWKNGLSIRAISRELRLGRHVIVRVISQHVSQTEAVDVPSQPASLGPIRLTRKSKLDAFIEPLGQLLERYPQLTAQRASRNCVSWAMVAVTPAFAIMSEHFVPSRKQLRFALKPRQARKLKWTGPLTRSTLSKKGVDG